MSPTEDLRPAAVAVVPAAGSSARMGGPCSKVFMPIRGEPMIVHTLRQLESTAVLDRIWLVVSAEDVQRCKEDVLAPAGLGRVEVVAGGPTRQGSVRRGLQALPSSAQYVVVHDGARPFVAPRLVEAVVDSARRYGAATCAVRVKDTLTRSDAEHFARESVDRDWLWHVQTPQAFQKALLLRAHEAAQDKGAVTTDDATLIRLIGGRVHLVEGDERNFKVTTPGDLEMAEAMADTLVDQDGVTNTAPSPIDGGGPMEIKTGLGYDIHRLEVGLRLVLGGVEIPHTHGLIGHSDADALTHCICDALLGASNLGDIGTLFPDTDPKYRDADSMDLLAGVVARVVERFEIMHVDSTVKAEAPKIGPHVHAIRHRLAELLGVSADCVSVKAKTGEGVGPVGQGLAIETEAVVTLRRRQANA